MVKQTRKFQKKNLRHRFGSGSSFSDSAKSGMIMWQKIGSVIGLIVLIILFVGTCVYTAYTVKNYIFVSGRVINTPQCTTSTYQSKSTTSTTTNCVKVNVQLDNDLPDSILATIPDGTQGPDAVYYDKITKTYYNLTSSTQATSGGQIMVTVSKDNGLDASCVPSFLSYLHWVLFSVLLFILIIACVNIYLVFKYPDYAMVTGGASLLGSVVSRVN
jgi:hypothetical protein